MFAKLHHDTGVKWLIHNSKHRKDNQLQCLKHLCRSTLAEYVNLKHSR